MKIDIIVTKANIAKACALLAIGIIIGYSVGFGHGAVKMLDWSVGVGLKFLKLNGVEVGMVNEEQLVWGIKQYRDQIGGCYPDLNITEIPI